MIKATRAGMIVGASGLCFFLYGGGLSAQGRPPAEAAGCEGYHRVHKWFDGHGGTRQRAQENFDAQAVAAGRNKCAQFDCDCLEPETCELENMDQVFVGTSCLDPGPTDDPGDDRDCTTHGGLRGVRCFCDEVAR